MTDAPAPELLAIYDMDKTITRRATYNGFLLHVMLRRSPWRLVFTPIVPFGLILYAAKIWSRERLKEFSLSLLIGPKVPFAEYAKYLGSYADHVLDKNVYPQLLARVAEEKALGYRLVMATASYRLYVNAIAERLGFDDVVATDLVTTKAGDVLAQIDGYNCYDGAKLDKVKAWMAENQLDRVSCHVRAYSDHVSDAPLLEFADEAFATNPHPPMLNLARARGWEILDWRQAKSSS